jgi:hypothetical protein
VEFLKAAIDLAEADENLEVLGTAADLLERFGAYAHAWRGLAAVSRKVSTPGPPEWDGGSLKDRVICVEQRIRHVGAVIRMARLVEPIVHRAARCIIRTDKRLVPIFQRTFEKATIVDADEKTGNAYENVDVRASWETLCRYLLPDWDHIADSFVPLRPNDSIVEELKERYRAGSSGSQYLPLVGIAWRSINPKKDILRIDEWGAFLSSIAPAQFVSLQYGNAHTDVEDLKRVSGQPILVDDSVDQFVDLDRFSAQVAAMDFIITISNTGAHLAGALAVPALVLLDGEQTLVWNYLCTTEPWYPSLRKIRRPDQADHFHLAIKAAAAALPPRNTELSRRFAVDIP